MVAYHHHMKASPASADYSKLSITQAFDLIQKSTRAATLFNGDAEKIYRTLMVICHPDRLMKESAAVQKRGADVVAKLNQLYQQYKGKSAPSSPAVFGKWVVERPIIGGDLADIYEVVNSTGERNILKIVRGAGDNDLMDREITSLKKLNDDPRSQNFKKYVPKLIDTFKASHRRASILTPAEMLLLNSDPPQTESLLSLSELMPMLGGKIDMKHIVWMSNRLLSALGWIHQNGIVHGAVVPPHLMFGPVTHHMVLIDWCYSVTSDAISPIPAIVKDYRDWYPREVFRKDNPTPATDIYMWAMMVRQCADHIPARMKGLLDWCLADSARTRPQNAWDVQDKWGKLAQDEFGKRRYLKLEIPVH